jgi:amino acid transporter
MPDGSDAPDARAGLIGQHGRFGTLAGVFTPTLLTILGVIMYLREGWVVGQVGLLGGWIVITLAFAVTACTALSLASITTNIRIGAGGAYSVISQSLGLEMGGSVGVPLYLSQVLATTMYIFGFREGWQWVFPNHPALLIDTMLFGLLFVVAYVSAGLAFKIQYGIAAVIGGSLVSIAWAAAEGSMQYTPELWHRASDATTHVLLTEDFWAVFAVFFPAATGIMAGANMSGELEDPRRSIPKGTLAAIGVSYVVYMILAYWLATSATPEQLRNNYTIMIDKAAWGPAVLAGLLGATLSSALSSIVGAPRILQALGEHDILPRGSWLASTTAEGEPRHAMIVTGGLVLIALLLRDLNLVAPFITMFFLITYGMINLVVLIEQSLELTSFRPQLKIPRSVPLIGTVGCIFAMFVINATISLVALTVVVAFYGVLAMRHLESPFADVRSGLFVAIAQWAAQRANQLPGGQERAWKPNLLLPVTDPLEARRNYAFVRDLVAPTGYLELMGIAPEGRGDRLRQSIHEVATDFRSDGVFARWTILEADDPADGLINGMEALGGSLFRPNMLWAELPEDEPAQRRLVRLAERAQRQRLGMVVFGRHPKMGLGSEKVVNLWVPDDSPAMELLLQESRIDLAILLTYTIVRNWEADLNLVTAVGGERQPESVRASLSRLVDLTRLPHPSIHLTRGPFRENLGAGPRADLDVFGFHRPPDFELMQRALEETRSSCLYVADSGDESALA